VLCIHCRHVCIAILLPIFVSTLCFGDVELLRGVKYNTAKYNCTERIPEQTMMEKPNVRVTLASKIAAEDCARLNLGYLDPVKVNVEKWKDREDESVLYVPKAGEVLYRLK